MNRRAWYLPLMLCGLPWREQRPFSKFGDIAMMVLFSTHERTEA
jgi:hypothetical protein